MKKIIPICIVLFITFNIFYSVPAFENYLPFDNIENDVAATSTPSSDLIRVTVDSKPVNFTDQAPIIKNDRTLVPLRAIFESLGSEVKWDEATQTVTGVKGENTIILKIGEASARVNEKTVTLDQPAEIINSRTMVPVRFISESLGCQVTWLEKNRMVVIVSMVAPSATAAPTKPNDGIDVEGMKENNAQPTPKPTSTGEAKSTGNYSVVGVLDGFDDPSKISRWYLFPEGVKNNVKVEYDASEKAPSITNNIYSVKLTLNPEAQKIKDTWIFNNIDVSSKVSKWKAEGANAISFWIKGNTEKIDSIARVNFAIKAKAVNSKGETRDTFYYGKIHDQVTDKKWTQVIIPLKSNGSNKNFDFTTGLYTDYPDYKFEVDNITSLRFLLDTKDKSGAETTFFGPVSFWVDQIEFIKQ